MLSNKNEWISYRAKILNTFYFISRTRNLPDGVKCVLLFLPFDRVTLAVDDCVRGDNAEGSRVGLDDFELDCAHASSNDESVSLKEVITHQIQ